MNNPNTKNPPVLTETLSVRLPVEFFRSLVIAANAKNPPVTLSHLVRSILGKSDAFKPAA